jgi:hypothetical protein
MGYCHAVVGWMKGALDAKHHELPFYKDQHLPKATKHAVEYANGQLGEE